MKYTANDLHEGMRLTSFVSDYMLITGITDNSVWVDYYKNGVVWNAGTAGIDRVVANLNNGTQKTITQ